MRNHHRTDARVNHRFKRRELDLIKSFSGEIDNGKPRCESTAVSPCPGKCLRRRYDVSALQTSIKATEKRERPPDFRRKSGH
jgi:hypothetical protein